MSQPQSEARPGIVDAIEDQNGLRWIRYGTSARSAWVRVVELAGAGAGIRRLIDLDTQLLASRSQRELQKEVAARTFRPGLAANAAGWLDGHYVLGTTEVLRPVGDDREVIVTFPHNAKFAPSGSLLDWQDAVEPFVTDQTFGIFALSAAFVGPLLGLMPPDYLNPMFEFVGGPHCGKSTLAFLAASAWAGNPASEFAGGESWALTVNKLDELKREHRDSLLVLDEQNKLGESVTSRANMVRQSVFSLASTGGKRRFGDDAAAHVHARVCCFSTSNRGLDQLISGPSDEQNALRDRLITIAISADRPFGVLDVVPPLFASPSSAIEALRSSVDQHYGQAGPAFVRRLQGGLAKYGEEGIRARLAKLLKRYRQQLTEVGSERVQKSFAAVMAAGVLASRWEVMPAQSSAVEQAIFSVANAAAGIARTPAVEPIERLRTYLKEHKSRVVDVAARPGPFSREFFEEMAAFKRVYRGGREILFPAAAFQRAFPDYQQLMRALIAQDCARTEGGAQPKLTIKAPRDICATGRVYCILSSRRSKPRLDG